MCRFVENLLCSHHPPPRLLSSGIQAFVSVAMADGIWHSGLGIICLRFWGIGATCMLCHMCVCQCEFGFEWCPEATKACGTLGIHSYAIVTIDGTEGASNTLKC